MLAFNHLGRLGQLGNQMFQYAALKGIATKHGYEYMVPKHDIFVDALGNRLRTELFDPFDIDIKTGILNVPEDRYLQEPHFEYSKEFVKECPDDVSIFGFFQSEKYFKHISDEIRKDFTFKKQIRDECEDIIDALFNDPIALHIRRGDFLINSANHHNLSLEYYERALKEFHHTREVIIFTDDPDWADRQELFSDDRFIISQNNGAYHDMYLMSKCSDFIIANSTSSWWGAWLCDNPEKRVICPKTWFGPNNQDKNTKDLYPKRWKVL